MLSANAQLIVPHRTAELVNSNAHLQINFAESFLAVLYRGTAGEHKAEHLLSFARLPPTHTPTEETQRGPGVLSPIHNAGLMGVDGGGVTVSASVSVQLSVAVGKGGILTCVVHNTPDSKR